jgi:ferritin
MLSNKMLQELNKQINAELYSAYLYLSMASYFESSNLKGFAHWMKVQAKEETNHAMKMYGYVNDRGARVTLTGIANPPVEWPSPAKIFEETYKHEQHVTTLIHNLVKLADSENDYATKEFLQWFVKEQVEEEASADEIRQQLKMIGESGGALLMLDKQLKKRE